MKDLSQPRAVLLIPDAKRLAAARDALKLVGIEGYAADSVDALVQRAFRLDTLMVIVEGGAEALAAIAPLRQEAKSRDVLVAIFTSDELAPRFLEAGAHVVQSAPVTPAGLLTVLLRLARRLQPGQSETPTLEARHVPLEVLKQLVQRHMARLKIFLGAAPGVGKTYAMLTEARDHMRRGEEVVIGLVESHGRRETLEMVDGLELVPRRLVAYKGAQLEEMDLDAILARRPAMVLVDELAHTNVPGSLNKKRYEDINVLRLAGIPVVSTLNVQHLESLNNVVERITGVKVRETVPDAILEEAAEVVLVDLPPEALQKRLQAGKIYAPEKITQSLANFFTTHNLTALRELADSVDEHLEAVRASIGKGHEASGIQDRVLVCVTPTASAERVLRRGARLADRLNAELFVVHVEHHPLDAEEDKALARILELAETFDAQVTRRRHPETGAALARFAVECKATIVVMGESRQPRWKLIFTPGLAEAILDKTSNIDIVTVATHA
ncbi:MAG: translation initiation factor [Cyanobacteria bacterium RYN_339]|nr:translation initiation factor [Cyanobacteria bacterium RYN_339]